MTSYPEVAQFNSVVKINFRNLDKEFDTSRQNRPNYQKVKGVNLGFLGELINPSGDKVWLAN